MVLKLLDDDIEADYNEGKGGPPAPECDYHCGNSGKNGAENGDKLHDGRKKSKGEGVFHPEYREPQIYQHADYKREKKLPLHPKTDLFLRTAPQAKHVLMVPRWSHNAQEIIYAGFLHRKIKGKDNDEDEA